jgi:hypothetical protein
MFSVARRVVNSDPSRLEMVKELWKIHPKLIVFYNFNYELQMLRSLQESLNPETGSKTSMEEDVSKSCITTNSTRMSGPNGFTANSSTVLGENSKIVEKGSDQCLKPKDGSHPTSSPSPCEASTSSATEKSTTATSSTIHCCWADSTGSPKRSSRPADSPSNNFSEKIWNNPSDISKGDGYSSTCMGKSEENLAGSSVTVGIAEWNGHKHEPIPSTDRWLYLVQYAAGAEGWNCIETDAMIMYSRNYSWKVYEQAQGRIDRLNSLFTDLWYYDFTSESWIDKAIGRSLKAKETFNEAKYMRMFAA